MPTLINEGKIYIAETPLYEIGTKDMTYFAYDEKEKIDILDKIGDGKYTIQRSKGACENQPRYDEPYHNEPRVTQTYQGSSCRCRTDSGNF